MASAMVRAPALRMAPTSSVMPARSLRDFLGTEQEQQLLRDGKRIGTGTKPRDTTTATTTPTRSHARYLSRD